MPGIKPQPHEWVRELPAAITVCDAAGVITEMNDAAASMFEADGGRALIGTSVLDCHPERARTIVQDLLATGRSNIYSIQKNGKRKMIVQIPWHRGGTFAGIVELSIEVPESIPHFNRDIPA